MKKHLTEEFKRMQKLAGLLTESTSQWLKEFHEFLDYPWQEDTEIDIVDRISQYYKFKDPLATYDYFKRWASQNKSNLDKILYIRTSDKFGDRFDSLFIR